jgi:hypothetical protein
VVDEAEMVDTPDTARCSVCDVVIADTFFHCSPCDAVICRRCVALDTAVVECDCAAEMSVTGVQSAALLAAAALG